MLQQDIRECGRRLHHTRVELLRSLAPYDDSGHWAASGAASCAHWIADTLDVAVGTAREWLRIAHALTQLPTVASAFTEHRLSYAAIRTLTRIAVDHPDHADDLVTLAVGVPARDLAPILAAWCAANEDDETRDRRHHRHTHLAIRTEPDGMAVLTLALPAISMGAVGAAIDARVMQGITQAPAHERNSLGHQRALAFLDLLTNHNTTVDTEIVVHIRSDGCTMHDGTPIADHTVAALIDTAFIRTLIHDADNHPINASGRQRHPNTRQRRVVDERHPRCVDCGATQLLEYDHQPDYQTTGRTDIDQLTRRCAPCHRARHRESDG